MESKVIIEPKIYQPQIDAKTNMEQIIHCANNFDQLNWDDLRERSIEWLNKDHEIGGRCQIDIKTNRIIVSVEIDGKAKYVDTTKCIKYGPIRWHTHLKGTYPSYPDLYNSLKSTLLKQSLWQVIIYKGSDNKPCLLLYRPKDCIFRKFTKLNNKSVNGMYTKIDLFAKFNKLVAKLIINIDREFRQTNDIIRSMSNYFEFKWIGSEVHPRDVKTLKQQMNFLKKAFIPSVCREIKRQINSQKKIKVNIMAKNALKILVALTLSKIILNISSAILKK